MSLNLPKIIIALLLSVLLAGCYSFTGGNIPNHLKTIYIPSVKDNSGYGNPKYRETLSQKLIEEFRNDGSLTVVEKSGDARLSVAISSIREETVAVNPGQVETERKIIVTCDVEYYDAVKKKQIWKKSFPNFSNYQIANAATARDLAISTAIGQLAADILFAVVSGW